MTLLSRVNSPTWKVFPSIADGIRLPNLDIANAGGGDLSAIVSQWADGVCEAAYTIEFKELAMCWIADEQWRSMQMPGEYATASYLAIAERSEAADELNAWRGDLGLSPVSHYLLIGLNAYAEVLSPSVPVVTKHADYGAAETWARGDKLAVPWTAA